MKNYIFTILNNNKVYKLFELFIMSFKIDEIRKDGKRYLKLVIGQNETIDWELQEIEFLQQAVMDLFELDKLQPVGKIAKAFILKGTQKKKTVNNPREHCSLFKPHYE